MQDYKLKATRHLGRKTALNSALALSLIALFGTPLAAQAADRQIKRQHATPINIVRIKAEDQSRNTRQSDRRNHQSDRRDNHRSDSRDRHQSNNRNNHRSDRRDRNRSDQHRSDRHRSDRQRHNSNRRRDHRRNTRSHSRNHRYYGSHNRYNQGHNYSYNRHRNNHYRTNYRSNLGINFFFGSPGYSSYRWASSPYSFYQPGNWSYSSYRSSTTCSRILVNANHYDHTEQVSVKQCYNPIDGYYIIQGSERVVNCAYSSNRW